MRVLDQLLKAVRDASVFNPDVQVAPACILWPDKDRQWEAIIPRLQGELPELMVLGDYVPNKQTGPAIWLRCVIAGKTDGIALQQGITPIIYLPGVSRQDLRAIEACPDNLKPLAELQYRGVIWSQLNAKDWTILAFLKSDQGGLGLDVAQDNETRNAMQLALYRLLDEDIDLLKGKRLDKDYFNTILTGGDPVRDLLHWLDQGDAFQKVRGENEWKAFVEVCKSQLAFNPQDDGVLAGIGKFAAHEGPWKAVWDRFCEAPKRYPNIPVQIRKCKMPEFGLFSDAETAGGWPQWNEIQEKELRSNLLALSDTPAHEARNKILELEKKHGSRRQLVWAEIGEAPLAQAMQQLRILAEITKNSLAAGTVSELQTIYQNIGWKSDEAVVRSLSYVDKSADVGAVTAAIRSFYLPWAEESARYLQKIWNSEADGKIKTKIEDIKSDCLVFVDGLRYDCGKRLAAILENRGCSVTEKPVWAALPSVTGTGKPAVAPIVSDNSISEEPEPYNFEPLTAYQLKKTIEDNGWKILGANDPVPEPMSAFFQQEVVNKLWVEVGDIDHEGHDRGWKLARHIETVLAEISDRIITILDAGWKNVKVSTDHGWLLLPGGLPKIEMPAVLAESKWGRCAALKPGASTNERLFPWFWNPNQYFALADGISCFRKGEEYAHGGLSLQECLTLELTITRGHACSPSHAIEFSDVTWKGMRCYIEISGTEIAQLSDVSVDIRRLAGNPSSSVIVSIKPLKDNGTASVVVEDEELLGKVSSLVLLNSSGELIAQMETVIGGGNK